ncbi:MAG: hypothetical protein ACFCU3_02070 [Verrucomicrobiales bacterium]
MKRHRWRSAAVTVLMVVAAHVALAALILSQTAKEFLPRANQPYVEATPVPTPPFTYREYRTVDTETGEQLHVQEYTMSTKFALESGLLDLVEEDDSL